MSGVNNIYIYIYMISGIRNNINKHKKLFVFNFKKQNKVLYFGVPILVYHFSSITYKIMQNLILNKKILNRWVFIFINMNLYLRTPQTSELDEQVHVIFRQIRPTGAHGLGNP